MTKFADPTNDVAFKKIFSEGTNIGKNEGINIGKNEKAFKIAKDLKDSGVKIDIISKTTGLSKDQIEKL